MADIFPARASSLPLVRGTAPQDGILVVWGGLSIVFAIGEDIKSSISAAFPSRLSRKALPTLRKQTPLTPHCGVLPPGRVLLPRAQPRV